MSTIPVMRPRLPRLERLVPYLSSIDSSRIYSNFGPLAGSLERRLGERHGMPGAMVTSVANATMGLTLALAAQGARPGTLCAIPAWTFVASAHAAVMAGLIPYFVDVDGGNWTLDPDGLAHAIAASPAAVGAVMPVMPFGRPSDLAAWDRFHARTGLPVVIDAAAGFDTVTPTAVPVVVSLHATKVLGSGEGGFIMSTDAALVADIRARSNFGFAGTREAAMPAANAKLSEYHAAVGLAALDEWSEIREGWMARATAYRRSLGQSNLLRFQDGFGQSWVTSTCVVSLDGISAARMEENLAQSGIETRRWWGAGAHAHAATAAFPRAALPATRTLSDRTIGLPLFLDLQHHEIEQVAACILALTDTVEPG
jgi:dTDP-4-amino-4,6-dideoxygalactose transaminase